VWLDGRVLWAIHVQKVMDERKKVKYHEVFKGRDWRADRTSLRAIYVEVNLINIRLCVYSL